MADFNFAALAQIGQLDNVAVPSATERKAQQVEMSGLMKQALFGNPQEQAAIATNVLLDTRLSQQQEIIDIRAMDPLAFATKYGAAAEANRYRYAQAERGLREQKNRERTAGQTAGDMALGFGQGVTNIVGSGVGIIAQSVDGYDALRNKLVGSEDDIQLAPYVSQATGFMTSALQGFKSDNAQTAEAQQAFEASILQDENRDEMLAEQEAMSKDAGFFERSFIPGAKRLGRDVVDVGGNALQNPQAMTNLVANAAGSLLPISLASRTVGTIQATRRLVSGGMSPEEASTFLSTAAGKKLVNSARAKAAVTLGGMSETGASVSQVQQAIMSMSETELLESEQFREMIDAGDTVEEARIKFASQAGTAAGLAALPAAFGASYLSRNFVANPFGMGAGRGAIVRNIGAETVEEAIQEGNTQAASNFGQNVIGLDVDPLEGVGGAAALGALGGTMIAGGMQAPAVAGATLGAAAGVVGAAAEAVIEGRERKADEASAVGSVAQAEAATAIGATGADVVSNLPETNQTAPSPTGVSARDQVGQALFLSPDEEAAFVGMFPNLAAEKEANPDRPLTRAALANTFGSIVSNKNASEQERQGAAFAFFETLNEMRAVDGDAVIAEVDSVESAQTKERFAALQSQLQTIESNPVIKKAQEALNALTPETVGTVIDMDLLNNKDADPAEKNAEAARVELLSRVAPEAVSAELIDMALNQVGGGRQAESLKKKLALARQVTDTFKAADESKAAIVAEQKAARDALPADQKKKFGKTYETFDLVREQVNTTGNKENALPSLREHRRLVSDAANSGHIERAQDLLGNLSDFAESQVNKLAAYAENKNSGLGAKKKVGYRASNGNGFFDQKGVWVDERNPLSIAQAREVEVDANSAVSLLEALAKAYGLDLPKKLVPAKLGLTGNPTAANNTTPPTTQEAQPSVEEDVDLIDDGDTATKTATEIANAKLEAEQAAFDAEATRKELAARNEEIRKLRAEREQTDSTPSNTQETVTTEGDTAPDTKGTSTSKPKSSQSADTTLTETEAYVELKNSTGTIKVRGPEITITDFSENAEIMEIMVNRIDIGIDEERSAKVTVREDNDGGYVDVTLTRVREEKAPIVIMYSSRSQSPFEKGKSRPSKENLTPNAGVSFELEAMAETSLPQEIQNIITSINDDVNARQKQDFVDIFGEALFKEYGLDIVEARIAHSEKLMKSSNSAATQSDQTKAITELRQMRDNWSKASTSKPAEAITEETVADPVETKELTEDPTAPAEGSWFDGLKGRLIAFAEDGRNVLLSAFRPREIGSVLPTLGGTVEGFVAAIDADQLNVEALDRKLTGNEKSAMRALVLRDMAAFTAQLQKDMNAYIQEKGLAEQIRSGKTKDLLGYRNMLPMNAIVGENADGFILDPVVMEAVFMGTIDWVIDQALRGPVRLDDEKVSQMFGMGRNGYVQDFMRTFANQQIPLQNAVEHIARGIEDLLGLDPVKDAAVRETQGMFAAFASNGLQALLDAGILKKTDVPYTEGTTKKGDPVMTGFRLSDQYKNDPAYNALSGLRTPFASVLTQGQNNVMYIGTAPKQINRNQIRNKMASVSNKAVRVMNKLQNTPYTLVPTMVDVVEAVEKDEFLRILGHRKITPDMESVTNGEHLSSIVGKNQSLEQGYAESMEYLKRADEYPQENGTAYSDVRIFFGWALSSVNRLQQQGPVTPQGDKIMRELLSATRSTLDLRNEDHVEALWLAIAQSIGVKIEQDTKVNVTDQAKSMVSEGGVLFAAAEVMRNFKATGRIEPGALENAIVQSGVEPTMKLLHALQVLAEFEAAPGPEFVTSLALEADGKTDGPINAMINMATGAFTPQQIMSYAKGGLFFTNEPMSLNKYIETEYGINGEQSTRAEDLYHLAAADFKKTLLSSQTKLEEMSSMLRVFDAFLPDFSYSNVDGKIDLKVERNLVKNPLTVFLYGSGEKGIADKLTNSMFKEIYKLGSEIAAGKADGSLPDGWRSHETFQKNPDLMTDLARFFGDARRTKAVEMMFDNPTTISMKKGTFITASKALEKGFAKPMLGSVNRVTGGLVENMRMLQRAASVQTAVFQMAVDQALSDKMAGKKLKELTSQELEDAFIAQMGLAPIYETPDASFHIAKATNTNTKVKSGATFREQLSSYLTSIRPADASVKISPYMTIGMGDGQMMLNIYDRETGELTSSLPVFDGVEMALDKIGEQAPIINKAVVDAWMQSNMFETALEGFDQMMLRIEGVDISMFDAQTLETLHKAFGLKDTENVTMGDFTKLRKNLKKNSIEHKARKLAQGRMATHTDHMAAVGAPHATEGVVAGNGFVMDFEGIAAQLNTFAREEMVKLLAAEKENNAETESDSYLDAADPEFQDALAFASEPVNDKYPGVRMVPGRRVAEAMSKMGSKLSPAKRKILKDVLAENTAVESTQYYYGTEAELTAFRAEFFDNLTETPIEAGISHLNHGVSFIANQTPETFLHEMLHAATYLEVASYYTDPESVALETRLAVQNLEHLMDETRAILNNNPSLEVLKNELDKKEGNPTAQIMEFISYVLANQSLSDLTQKTNTVQRFSQIFRKSLAAIKKLLGLKARDMPTKDIFDQVRFNTKVIGLGVEGSMDTIQQDLFLHQMRPPKNEAERRARTTHERYQRRAQQFLEARMNALKKETSDESAAQLAETKRDAIKLEGAAKKASERAVNAGFRMNKEQLRAFRSVFAVMDSAIEFRPALMRQLHSLHDAVLEKLTAQDLFDAGAIDMDTAETQLAYIQNGRDRNVLTTFMALAESSEQFRKVLEDMDVTAGKSFEFNSFDTAIEAAGGYAMSALAQMSFKNVGRKGAAAKTLNKLSQALSALDTESRVEYTDGLVSSRIDKANEYVAGKLDQAGQAVDQFARRRRATARNPVTKVGFDVMGFIGSMASREASADRGEGMTAFLNNINGWNSVRSALHDLRGGTAQNLDILRLINPVKAMVDALRQDFREKTPETLAKQFNDKLKPQVWSAMHKAFGVTDLMAVGLAEAKGIVGNPDTVGQRIRDAEEQLQSAAPQLANRYSDKAWALARWRVTGDVTSMNLLRNSKAIANLFNENNRPNPSLVTADIEAQIERLVALYAYDMIDSATQNMLAELMRKEPEGLGTVLGLTMNIRALEKEKKLSADPQKRGLAENNAVQGYIPSLGQAESKVDVFEDKDQYELEMRGWTRIGDYKGSREEDSRVRRGYYQSSTAGKATFKQGIAQTVHSTYSGVSTLTGRLSDDTAGALTGVRAKRIGERLSKAPVGSLDNLEPGEYMLPVFDHQGTVIGYDLSMKPEMTKGLQKDTHMGRMLGVWAGRLLEEEAAHEFNKTLVDGIVKHYRDGKDKGRSDEYVNIASKTLEDPIYKDAWSTLGAGIKEYAEEQFGTAGFFPVRKDLIEDAVGYRAASVTDVWTGQSRLAEPAQKVVKDLATLIMGKKAYPWMKKGEMFVQDAVGVAKTTIIVRSAFVGVANITSNVLHLTLRGVPLTKIGTSGREKILEIQEYVRNKEKIGELQIEYAANVQNKNQTAKIEARIAALEAANKRMSIAPLIEAGEFSTISEDLTEADVAIREGRIMDYMEKAVDKLPETAGTVARNLLITKDTALFKGLNRMVQYGDFVAKAVLYDHLMSQGKDQREVLDIIMEEFVQYNRLPGRGRDYLESMGTLWFMNYALRIMKVMGKMMRERPLSSLVLMGQVGPAAGIDSVASGSLAGKYADGSLGFSVGPEMGLNAWTLNPWFNIAR